MAFVNEYISEEDVKKYNIKEIDEKLCVSHHEPSWTIDRERGVFIRYAYSGREELSSRITFYIYWNGRYFAFSVDVVEAGGVWRGEQWARYKLYKLWDMNSPSKPVENIDAIWSDIKDALTVYKDNGVYSSATRFTALFD